MKTIDPPKKKAFLGIPFLKRKSPKAPPSGPGANRQPPGPDPNEFQAEAQQVGIGATAEVQMPGGPIAASASTMDAQASATGESTAAIGTVLETPAQEESEAEEESKDESGVDDLLDIFKDNIVVNEELRRLAGGLDQVDVQFLVGECRKLASQLQPRG